MRICLIIEHLSFDLVFSGGTFLATGSSDPIIRVYMFSSSGPEKLCELEAHSVSMQNEFCSRKVILPENYIIVLLKLNSY